jgi:hypothetical protein
MSGEMTHTCNPTTQESEGGESKVHGQSGLHNSEFKTIMGCISGTLSQNEKNK